MTEIYGQIKKTLLHGDACVLCRVEKTEGSVPGKEGAVMLVLKDGKVFGTVGGGNLEQFCRKEAGKIFGTEQSVTETFNLDGTSDSPVSMICGGKTEVSFTFVSNGMNDAEIRNLSGEDRNRRRVVIFGGGHVGKELCSLLVHLEFDVVIYDDREEYASLQRHPDAQMCICGSYEDFEKNIGIEPEDFVAIMTHGHVADREVLLKVCRINPCYIGCIGSRKKVETTKKFLEENGIPQKVIDKVKMPIGLEIGSSTPAEIAVSVAAQLIKHNKV